MAPDVAAMSSSSPVDENFPLVHLSPLRCSTYADNSSIAERGSIESEDEMLRNRFRTVKPSNEATPQPEGVTPTVEDTNTLNSPMFPQDGQTGITS
jgi:hypothetical protein